MPARPLALANLLTYGRIAAVPVVVALMYWHSILDGGLWLRWIALAVFITAGITDVLDGYVARAYGQPLVAWGACSTRSPTSFWSLRAF